MISAEAPILFAKACEFFILELTLRSWMETELNKRRTLQVRWWWWWWWYTQWWCAGGSFAL